MRKRPCSWCLTFHIFYLDVYSTQPVIIPPNLVTAPQSDDEDADYMEGDIFDDSEADQNFEESDVLNESDEEDNNLEE